ncbi:MAG: electron transport complex subunit RsxC [Actinobacteria bacterium]|nr:electron transport complex subunit RsxC [Actinomycetota bacterium]
MDESRNTVIRKRSVFKGVKLSESKLTADKPIESLPLPEKIILPLQQHIGAPCSSIVNRGDYVLTGQKVADVGSFVSSPIHSSISGKVVSEVKIINPVTSNPVDALVIESDGEDKWIDLDSLINPQKEHKPSDLISLIDSLVPKDMITRIREAGIVGLGGATFPTHVKLSPPPGKKIDTFILNGCECEPYITSDHRIMLEYTLEVVLGAYIIGRILMPEKMFVAIEDNKEDAIKEIDSFIKGTNLENKFQIVSLKSRYPMGAEKTLVKTIVGREVPIGGLPLDVGVVVNNVGTSKAVYEAVVEGKPLVEKVITVTGAVNDPKNLTVRIGTPLRDLIDYCGGSDEKANTVITGGPMMGISISDIDFPVIKGTNCVLVKKGSPASDENCIRCSRCVSVCPMNLMPLMFVRGVRSGMYEVCKEHYIEDCIECGCCAYVCPANIPIVSYIKVGKSKI